jgi:orotate phosphoribosyltransferase
MDDARSRLLEIIKERSFRRGDFTLASGKKSTYYVDGKHTTLDPEGSVLLAEAILDLTAEDDANAVGGLTLGADPIVGATVCTSHQRKRPLKGLIVRKEAKDHGTGQQVEGPFKPGDKVIVVEDVTTTGNSAFKAIQAIEAAGGKVVRVVTMLDRLQGAGRFFAEKGYRFSAIFTIRDLGVSPEQGGERLVSQAAGGL